MLQPDGSIVRQGAGTGRFAQVAGFTFTDGPASPERTFDADGNATSPGSRIPDVTLDDRTPLVVGGVPVAGAPSVNVAINNFNAGGGDQYPVLPDKPQVNLGAPTRTALADDLASLGSVGADGTPDAPGVNGRIFPIVPSRRADEGNRTSGGDGHGCPPAGCDLRIIRTPMPVGPDAPARRECVNPGMDATSAGHTGPATGGANGEALIALRGVGRRYTVGAAEVVALDAVDLDITHGEFVVVLGPSGSGKSTLLNVIGALDSPTSGSVVIAGRDITRAGARELARFRRGAVSFIFQTFNLFPQLTALENVEFGADVSRRPSAREVAHETLERVGLGDRIDHFPHELSGGEQQRVAVARGLASGNPILLADEPTGELDFRTGVQILQLLHDQTHEMGMAVIVVTHNREIARVADRVIELSSGRVVSDAPNEGGPAPISELQW